MTTTTDNHTMDQALFRGTVGHYASGITIITGHDGQGPIGFTCQAFYSVSVDPPLVSFSVMKTSTTYPRIHDTGNSRSTFCPVDRKQHPTNLRAEAPTNGRISGGDRRSRETRS